YSGIQLRSNILPEYEARPRALADELAKRHLTFVALSSGNVVIDPPDDAKQIAMHVAHAKFVRECGGLYLQCMDERPKRTLAAADYQRLGRLLTEIGKRTADLGIPLGYHNHMNSMGERPEEVDQILAAADPKYVKFELDIAHYQQGGGDPLAAIRKYASRLLFLHIKDVESTDGAGGAGRAGGAGGARPYRFAEARRLLERYRLRVACIASPIFKVDWPGAPRSKYSPQRDEFSADFTYDQQNELLDRAFELARVFNTDRIRIFDFWRLEDQAPHRSAIDAKLRE